MNTYPAGKLPPAELTASAVGAEIDYHALPIDPATAHLCAAFELDPLGVISSGALLIGCTADSTDTILAALHDANIAAARIGTVRPPSFGLQLRREGHLTPLPTFPTDEIARLFA